MVQMGIALVATIAGIGLLVIGVTLHVVGLATTSWSTASKFGVDAAAGLWQYCIWAVCHDYKDKSAKLKACEAFAIIGMLGGLAAAALGLLHFMMRITGRAQNVAFPLISAVASYGSLGSIIICVSIWASSYEDYIPFRLNADFSFSFILSIIGGVLISIGGSLVFVSTRFSRQ